MSKFSPNYFMVRVRSINNTYLTDKINGQQASCTAGAEQAAAVLGRKVFGPGAKLSTIKMDGSGVSSVDWFEVHASGPLRTKKQAGFAVDTLLLVIACAIAALAAASVIVVLVSLIGLIKLLGEME